MYIKELNIENYGPIDKFEIKPSFNEDGSPVPYCFNGKKWFWENVNSSTNITGIIK